MLIYIILNQNNQQVLGNILGISTAKERSHVYRKHFYKRMQLNNGMLWLNHVTREQNGGGQFIEISTKFGDYIVNIHQIEGEIVSVDGHKYPNMEIYFMSLVKESRATDCIWLTVDPEEQTGYGIRGRDEDTPFSIYEGEDQGAILLENMIKFARFNAKRFHIARLELDDIARRSCNKRGDTSFMISESNMLQGRYPYYMKYGFVPVSKSAKKIIDTNISKINDAAINSRDLISSLEMDSDTIDESFRKFLSENDGKMATTVANKLMTTNCVTYSMYYKRLYEYYGLRSLRGEDSIYELVL